MLTRLLASLQGFLRRREIDGEIDEEIRDHLEHAIDAYRSRGASPEEARRLALRDLGGLTQTMEASRAVRATWLDAVSRDIAFAARVLRRSPRFTITALTLLVLGIGSATAIFSITYAVLVRPLPYPNSARLVYLAEKNGAANNAGVAWPNFDDWRQRAKSFDGMAGSLADQVILTNGELPRRLEARDVTSDFFRVLATSPMLGRLFTDADARLDAPPAIVVSYEFWLRELGGADAAIGRTVSLNQKPFIVVGVLPRGFRYFQPADVYRLLEPLIATNYRGMQGRQTHTTLYGVARLKAGVSIRAAQAEMSTIASALALEYPKSNANGDVHVVALEDFVVGSMSPTLTVLTGAVALLLLIACVNLASLLLNRSASRGHEFSIRAAIGGSRLDLVRQLLVEQTLLVVIGGVFGAIAGAAMLRGFIGIAPPDMPRLNEIRLDFGVLFATTVFCCACAFVVGLVPAFKASALGGQAFAIRSSRGSTPVARSLRRGLTIAEIAVAMVLLSGSALMVHTMVRLTRVDPGFDSSNLHTFQFSLTGPAWPDEKKALFYDAAVARLRAVRGVENAAITYTLPLLGSNWWNRFTIGGTMAGHWESIGETPNAGMVPVTAGYFETLRIPLIKGRYFDRTETSTSVPVAVINSSVAKKYWPDADPIGQQIRQGSPSEPYGPWRTIVGVVGDIKQHGVDQETPQQLFLPAVQQPRTTVYAIARTRGPMASASLEAVIHDLDRSVPVFNDKTVDRVMRDAASRRRVAMVVLSVFAGVALLLAAVGLYGVIAQSVAERRQEIGVRVALGATPREIIGMFVRYGLVVVVVGIASGAGIAIAAAQSLKTLVFGITVTDPMTLGVVAAALTAVTLLACYLPARSATRVDPIEALRAE